MVKLSEAELIELRKMIKRYDLVVYDCMWNLADRLAKEIDKKYNISRADYKLYRLGK